MDKIFVDKYNLAEDVKRFKELNEYKSPRQSLKEFTLVTRPVMNEEGENQQDQNMDNNVPNQGPQQDQNVNNNTPNQNPQQAGGQMDTSQPSNNNMEQPPMNNDFQQPQDDMQQMPTDNGGMQGGEDMAPSDMDIAPEGDFEDNDTEIETTEMEPDDEVIDVDDLTQSQQATEYKIDGVDDRIAKLYDVVQKFAGIVNDTNSKIDTLRDEFEKRNPTNAEKINIRSQAGTPFTQSPKAYWDNEVKSNPHYDTMFDNDVDPNKEQEEFEIRKGDVDNFNLKSISDTLNYNPKLEDYISF